MDMIITTVPKDNLRKQGSSPVREMASACPSLVYRNTQNKIGLGPQKELEMDERLGERQ